MNDNLDLDEWLKEWFYRPGSISTPEDDRMYCYEVAACLIKNAIRGNLKRSDRRVIFDLLTYLLLGWNPITEWPNESVFEPQGKVEDWSRVKTTMRDLLNLEHVPDRGRAYELLAIVVKECTRITDVHDASLYEGERITMLMLALWLLDPNTTTPKLDLGLVRACLDLYYTSEAAQTLDNVKIIYGSTRSTPNHCAWIVKQIDRLFVRNTPTDELMSSVAYLGWFSSMVRISRMMRTASRTSMWIEIPKIILREEVAALKTTLYDAEMKCESEKVRDGSCLWCAAKLFRMLKGKRWPAPKLKERVVVPIEASSDNLEATAD